MIWDERGHLLGVGEFRAGRFVSSVLFFETGEVEVVRRKVSDDPPREIAEHFYAGGTRSIRAESAADQLDGLFQTWYPDGRPKFEGRYVDGARAGTWKFWSEDGILREVDYSTTPTRVDPPAAPAP